MYDGCYIDHFPFDSRDDAIGKPLKEIASESPIQEAPHGGMLLNLFEGHGYKQPIPGRARTLVAEKLRDHPHFEICVNNRPHEYTAAIRAAYLPIGP